MLERSKRSALLLGCLLLTLLLAACREPPKPTIRMFVAKPEQPPPTECSYEEAMELYTAGTGNGSANEQWQALVAAGPPWVHSLHAEVRPMPGTPWYEYVLCRRDFSSALDEALLEDYLQFLEQADTQDINAALRQLVAGTVASELGMLEPAANHFHKAVFWMEEATDTDLETLAALGRTDVKIYKGDAYERSMVHFYLGLIAYMKGDFLAAKREFHRALLADGTKPAEDQRGNFALLHYWLGKTYARLDDEGNARVAITKALACHLPPEAGPLVNLDALSNHNLTVLVQLGAGARLVPRGADWQVTTYQQTDYPERAAEVFIDGKHTGTALPLADLWRQISTQGMSEEQKLQHQKAAGKALLQVIPYINLLGVAWDVTGDMRSWSMLPDQIHVWSGSVQPGEHDITVRFYDENELEMTRYAQTWYYVPVRDGSDRLLVVRSGRDKCCQRESQIEEE